MLHFTPYPRSDGYTPDYFFRGRLTLQTYGCHSMVTLVCRCQVSIQAYLFAGNPRDGGRCHILVLMLLQGSIRWLGVALRCASCQGGKTLGNRCYLDRFRRCSAAGFLVIVAISSYLVIGSAVELAGPTETSLVCESGASTRSY